MSNQRYLEEIEIQAVNQMIEKQFPVSELAAPLGVSMHSLSLPTKAWEAVIVEAGVSSCGWS